MKTTLYLIRHGLVDSPKNTLGQSLIYGPDQPLNIQGKEQMRRLGQRLRMEGVHFDVLISSPYLRAQQSANIFKDALTNAPDIEIENNVRATATPQWDGRPEQELALSGDTIFDSNLELPHILGETLSQSYERITGTINTVVQEHENQTIGIVMHGDEIGLYLHYLHAGTDAHPGIDPSIQKGEAIKLTFENSRLLEQEHITAEWNGGHKEKRG